MKSHATDDGMKPGEHLTKDGSRVTMPTKDRCRKAGLMSNATDNGMEQGQHRKKNGDMSMSMKDRINAMNKGQSRLTDAQRSERARKGNMSKPMNGTAHLNPNSEADFMNHCKAAKKLLDLVRQFTLFINNLSLIMFANINFG